MKEELKKYLDKHLKKEPMVFGTVLSKAKSVFMDDYCFESSEINNYIKENKEEDTFQTKLFNYIDEKGLKDSDVYNKVNLDRRLFSKIRSNKHYHPSKDTVILLGIALELSETEIEGLLESASYSLPMNTTYDLIIRFCFKNKIYDLNQINDFLYDYNCKVLN